jgi:hypothetical protein
MPTTAKIREPKGSMFAAIYLLGRVAGGVDFERPEQRIAMRRVISPIRCVPNTQVAVMYVTLCACTVRAQFRWMCRHEI